VQRKDGIARKPLEQSRFEHRLRAAETLLGGLEDEVYGAVEQPRGGEVFRRALSGVSTPETDWRN
jgi:hypothetical protein